uniref:Uncharacterized protein n=1 Tax=Glossina palpalis gambiensis TaxID=67801 RepID=A0A1B0BWK8_9MUSC
MSSKPIEKPVGNITKLETLCKEHVGGEVFSSVNSLISLSLLPPDHLLVPSNTLFSTALMCPICDLSSMLNTALKKIFGNWEHEKTTSHLHMQYIKYTVALGTADVKPAFRFVAAIV